MRNLLSIFVLFFSLLTCSYYAIGQTEASACANCPKEKNAVLQALPTPEKIENIVGKCPANFNSKFAETASDKIWSYITSLGMNSKESLYQEYGAAMAKYNSAMNKRIAVNASLLNTKARASEKSNNFLFGVHKLQDFIHAVDEFDNKGYLKKFLNMPAFGAAVKGNSNLEFLLQLRDFNFQNTKNSLIINMMKSSDFRQSLAKIQATLRDPTSFKLVVSLGQYDLSVLNQASRNSAFEFHKFMQGQGVDANKLAQWHQTHLGAQKESTSLPLLSEVPFPTNVQGPFAEKYRSVVQAEATQFLFENIPTESEIRTAGLKEVNSSVVAEIQNIIRPVEKVAYDDWIVPLHKQMQDQNVVISGKVTKVTAKQLAAIDAVARTLWGEVRSCEAQGAPQYDAVGLIIAKRALSVEKALLEKEKVEKENKQKAEKFNAALRGEESLDAFVASLSVARLNGLSDFGRNGTSLTSFEQVVSKPLQFSCLNSSLSQKIDLKKVNPNISTNIPISSISIQRPLTDGDNSALFSVICPNLKEEKRSAELWRKAVDVASQMVLNTEQFVKSRKFDTAESDSVYFYTHGFDLPFATQVPATNMTIADPTTGQAKSIPLSAGARGPCRDLRLFKAKVQVRY